MPTGEPARWSRSMKSFFSVAHISPSLEHRFCWFVFFFSFFLLLLLYAKTWPCDERVIFDSEWICTFMREKWYGICCRQGTRKIQRRYKKKRSANVEEKVHVRYARIGAGRTKNDAPEGQVLIYYFGGTCRGFPRPPWWMGNNVFSRLGHRFKRRDRGEIGFLRWMQSTRGKEQALTRQLLQVARVDVRFIKNTKAICKTDLLSLKCNNTVNWVCAPELLLFLVVPV